MSFLNELRIMNIARQKEWDPENKASLSFRGLEFAGEAGELASKIKKLARKTEYNFVGSDYNLKDIEEEVGDVLITLDLLCNMIGINIEKVTREKFNSTSEKVGLKTKFKDREINESAFEMAIEELKTREALLKPHFAFDANGVHIGTIFAPKEYQFNKLKEIYYGMNNSSNEVAKFRCVEDSDITVPKHLRNKKDNNEDKLYAVASYSLGQKFFVLASDVDDARQYVEYACIPVRRLDVFRKNVQVFITKRIQTTKSIL